MPPLSSTRTSVSPPTAGRRTHVSTTFDRRKIDSKGVATMKRSRTCMNLVELDAPAAPKRTCSLPNLSWNGASRSIKQNHRDTLLFLKQQHALSSALSRGTCEGSLGLLSVPAAQGRLPVLCMVVADCFLSLLSRGVVWNASCDRQEP